MSSQGKDVLLDCECSESLLDHWLPASIIRSFQHHLSVSLQSLSISPQLLSNFSLYRFIIPPFLAFLSIPWSLGVDKEEIIVDIDQFTPNRKETRESFEKKLLSTPCKGHKINYYSDAWGGTEKPIMIIINLVLPGQNPSEIEEGMGYAWLSLKEIERENEIMREIQEKKMMKVKVSERKKIGIFEVDEACANLTLSMAGVLHSLVQTLKSDPSLPAISSLSHTSSTLHHTTTSLSVPPLSPPLSPYTPLIAPLSVYQSTIQSDISILKKLVHTLKGEEVGLPCGEMLYMVMEEEEDGSRSISIVNKTGEMYTRLDILLNDRRGALLMKVDAPNIVPPFETTFAYGASQIAAMVSLGGVSLSLSNGSQLSLLP